MTRTASLTDRVAAMVGADDWQHDPWGTAMGLFFDVASVLDMSDVEGDVTPVPFARWGYRRAPFTVPSIETVASRADDFAEGEWSDDFTYGQIVLACAVADGELSQGELIRVGDVLNRYVALCRLAGRDY